MRILFHGPVSSCHRPTAHLPFLSGIPAPIETTLGGLKDNHNLTSNRGNLIHAEAPSKTIKARPNASAFGNIPSLHQAFPLKVGEVLARNFDLIVYSTANFITGNKEMVPFANALRAVAGHVPFIVLGAGMQGNPDLENVHSSVREILSIFNEKALLFGVRGAETERWLHENGFTKARALGCPSMYVYPQAINSVEAPSASRIRGGASYLTAGYPTVRGGHNFQRGVSLAQAFRNAKASYVFQDEFFQYGEITKQKGIYNPALSTCDRTALNELLSKNTGKSVNFSNYYYFSETSAWRQVAAAHDVYCGDRFHGGIASLHAGKPALFMAHDNRVREMCDFFGLPWMTTQELAAEGPAAAVTRSITPGRITDMKRTYTKRLDDYKAAMKGAGISLRN